MIKKIAICLLVAAPLSAPAVAAPVDGQAMTQRATAQNAVSIKNLETTTRLSPSDGGSYIELAAAYLRAGRTADAMRAFHRALVLDNEMMDTGNGNSVWSHEIARQALSHEVTLTAR